MYKTQDGIVSINLWHSGKNIPVENYFNKYDFHLLSIEFYKKFNLILTVKFESHHKDDNYKRIFLHVEIPKEEYDSKFRINGIYQSNLIEPMELYLFEWLK